MAPYVYPGTNVLKNLRTIRHSAELATFEAEASMRRIKEMENAPIHGSFDAMHLKAIHGHIFQDVFAWAGRFRTVNIAVPDQFYFAFADQIDASVSKLLGELHQEQRLKGLKPPAFATRAGHYLGELNAIHPFWDGNGRTQREFVRELALEKGSTLNWSRVSPEQMRNASRVSFQLGNNAELVTLIRTALGHSAKRKTEAPRARTRRQSGGSENLPS